MFNRPRDERHRPTRTYSRNRMSQRRQRICRQRIPSKRRIVENVIFQQPPIYRQGTQHEGVHRGPADRRRRCAFVQGTHPFALDGLDKTIPWSGELGGGGGLETDFDRVEGVANGQFCDAAEYAGDKAIIG